MRHNYEATKMNNPLAVSETIAKKETLYKTCKFEGEYVGIEAWFVDGDSFMYRISKLNGDEELVHFSECSDFCL